MNQLLSAPPLFQYGIESPLISVRSRVDAAARSSPLTST